MNSIKTFALALSLITLASATAFAMRHGAPFDHKGKQTAHIEQLKARLDLTAEQETEITKIFTENKEMRTAQREDRHKNQEALRNILSADNIDEAQIKALTQKQAELHAARLIEKHATMTRINQILTPEQQDQHAALRLQRMEQRGKRDCAGPKGRQEER